MNFSYTYRTSDGERHIGEMSAKSRDDVFAALRAQGIKPMKVMAQGGDGRPFGWWAVGVPSALVAAAAIWFILSPKGNGDEPLPEGVVAVARPRHFLGANIPEGAIFKDPTERYLAVFAEPGRNVRVREEDFYEGAFAGAVARPVMIMPEDSPPVAEFKRIVAGLKEEAQMQLKGGKGAKDVAAWFADRQRMEAEWRNTLLDRVKAAKVPAAAANRMLSSMGFKPIQQ